MYLEEEFLFSGGDMSAASCNEPARFTIAKLQPEKAAETTAEMEG